MSKKSLIFAFSIFLMFSFSANAQGKQPKTVRDYFMLLPEKYFDVVWGDSKEEYLGHFLKVEDTANGYLSGGAEAGQGGFEMALFKKPTGGYVIGFYTFNEAEDLFYFLEYRGGKWFDVSKKVVPDYGKGRWYVLPQVGTKVEVFERKFDKSSEMYEKGKKLYDIAWQNGKFVKQ
jgi:hypothetical protein